MASVVKESGEAWDDETRPGPRRRKKASRLLDRIEARIIRARTFRAVQLEGYSLRQVAVIYRFSVATVSLDLRWLRTLAREGLDALPDDAT